MDESIAKLKAKISSKPAQSAKPSVQTNGTKSLSNGKAPTQTQVKKPDVKQASLIKKSTSTIKPSLSASVASNGDKSQSKKRPNLDNEKSKKSEADSKMSPKKPKLSLSDYKMMKGSTSEVLSKKSEENNHDDTLDDLNDEDFNMLASNPYEDKNNSGGESSDDSNKYKPSALISNDLTSKKEKIIVPPVPLQPLSKDFLFESSSNKNSETTKSTTLSQNSSTTTNNRFRNASFPTFPGASSMYDQIKSDKLGDDEALSRIMQNKHSKRVLYTGKKNTNPQGFQPSRLYDICVKALVDQLDGLAIKISEHSKIFSSLI